MAKRNKINKKRQPKGKKNKIKVVGVGGSGCAVIDRIMKFKIPNIELIAINTDAQSLSHTSAHRKIRIGRSITKGFGTGMDPSQGQQAAENARKKIIEALRGADIIFLVSGLGGGAGSGALPVLANLSRELDILTIALVTKPFIFEGPQRMAIAEQSIKFLESKVDALITIANERILQVIDRKTPLLEAFGVVDNVLKQTIISIVDIINSPGLVNVDLADLRAILRDAGPTLLGIGQAEGDGRAIQAVKAAIESPLLDLSIKGARGILFIITGGPGLTMYEVNEAAKYITELSDSNCRIIFGAVINPEMTEKIKIVVMATGFTPDVSKKVEMDVSAHHLQSFFEKKPEIASTIQAKKIGPAVKLKRIIKPEKNISEDELEIPAFLRKKK